MWGTSIPLAATSVAIKILNFISLKFFIIVFLLLCRKPPWSGNDLILLLESALDNFSVPYLVLTKIRIEPLRVLIWLISSSSFSSDFNSIVSCLIFLATVLDSPTDIRIGSFKYLDDNLRILFGIVAENIKTCLLTGKNFIILFIWTSKPISSILSVSSNTKYFVSWRFKVPLCKWSFILPGVPT